MESIKSLVVAGIIILLIIAGGIFFYSRGNTSTATNSSISHSPVVDKTRGQQTASQTIVPTQMSQQVISSGEQDITITKNGFSPSNTIIKLGTRVKWINNSGNVVAVNSFPYPTHTSYPAMNFGQFGNGSSVELVFDKTGSYKYLNDMNQHQTGTIIVE